MTFQKQLGISSSQLTFTHINSIIFQRGRASSTTNQDDWSHDFCAQRCKDLTAAGDERIEGYELQTLQHLGDFKMNLPRATRPGEPTFCYGKSPFWMGKSTISMAIFNCYVSSPEGTPFFHPLIHRTFQDFPWLKAIQLLGIHPNDTHWMEVRRDLWKSWVNTAEMSWISKNFQEFPTIVQYICIASTRCQYIGFY